MNPAQEAVETAALGNGRPSWDMIRRTSAAAEVRQSKLERTMREISVLFIRSDGNLVQKVEDSLKGTLELAIEWVQVESLFDGLKALQERSFDLILSDLFLPDGDGLATVRHLTQQGPPTPLIVFCPSAERETGVNAVRKGAHDFFCYEDLDAESLRRSVQSALRNASKGEPAQEKMEDRRINARFPCRLAVSYQALEHPFLSGEATSETLNISSKGLLFTTSEPLQPGQLLQVSVDWPARLENQVPLKLVAEGRIIRNVNGQLAMTIDKYEFRTRRIKPTPDATKKTETPGTAPTKSGVR